MSDGVVSGTVVGLGRVQRAMWAWAGWSAVALLFAARGYGQRAANRSYDHLLVSSALGGRFPAGFPVGTVTALKPDDSRAFLIGDLKPAAPLERGRDVLLLSGFFLEENRCRLGISSLRLEPDAQEALLRSWRGSIRIYWRCQWVITV